MERTLTHIYVEARSSYLFTLFRSKDVKLNFVICITTCFSLKYFYADYFV
jgi:hypothetical protein